MNSPFDETRYRGLLEGLEAVEIKYSALNSEIRYEAEYYRKRFLMEDKERLRYKNIGLGEIAFITDGQHGYHKVDEESNIFMLTAKNAKNWFSDIEGADRIAKWVDDNNKRSSLAENDLILSTRGTVGLCALVVEEILPANIDQDVARIAIYEKSGFYPAFVLAYLNSCFGQDYILRNSSGMVQQGISLEKVRQIPIPMLSENFQLTIAENIKKAYMLRKREFEYYREAENTLLAELGLLNWQPPEDLSYERKASEAFLAGRLDAEHFQPKYLKLLECLRETGYPVKPLGELIRPIFNGYDHRDFLDEGTPYIRVGDVKRGRINMEGAAKISVNTDDIAKDISLNIGDVLFTRKGSYGNSAVVTAEHVSCIISSEIMLLRLNEQGRKLITPDYLPLFLNSMAGYMQVEQWVHGAAFYSIAQGDMARLEIPILPISQQLALAELIVQSKDIETAAKALLDRAKRAVEIAIETHEAAALQYLNQASQ